MQTGVRASVTSPASGVLVTMSDFASGDAPCHDRSRGRESGDHHWRVHERVYGCTRIIDLYCAHRDYHAVEGILFHMIAGDCGRLLRYGRDLGHQEPAERHIGGPRLVRVGRGQDRYSYVWFHRRHDR